MRLERNACFLSAVGANGSIELLAFFLLLASAVFAHLGLVFKALFRIEFLLTGGEHKFISAAAAY